MIPDKIYLVKDAANPEGVFDTVASKKPMFQDDIAYIRKDALIEWLESKIKDLSNGGFVNGLTTLAYKDVIEHINEM